MINMRRVKRAMAKRRKQKIMPFKSDNYTDSFYCKANMDRLLRSIKELEAGKGSVHELIEV